MACQVEKFPPLPVCLSLLLNLWNICTCMCEHYVEMWRVCVRVPLLLTGPESTYRETSPHFYTPSLSPQLQATILPLFHCSSYSACLSQRCTPACLKLLLSRGFQQCWSMKPSYLWDKFILKLSLAAAAVLYIVADLSCCWKWTQCTAQNLAGSFLGYIVLFVMCSLVAGCNAPQVAGSSLVRQRETWGDFLTGSWKA